MTMYTKLENCAVLGYYAASSDNFLPPFRYDLSVTGNFVSTFQDNLTFSTSGGQESLDSCLLTMGPVRLFRNVGTKLPLLAA